MPFSRTTTLMHPITKVKFKPCYFITLFGPLKPIGVVLACGLEALDQSPNMEKPKLYKIGTHRYPAKDLHIANFIEYTSYITSSGSQEKKSVPNVI